MSEKITVATVKEQLQEEVYHDYKHLEAARTASNAEDELKYEESMNLRLEELFQLLGSEAVKTT